MNGTSPKHRRAKAPDVLLINPNRMKPPVAPLGLELLAHALQARGITPKTLDLSFARAPLKEIQLAVKELKPGVIGISVRNLDDCYYASRSFLLNPVKRYVREIKEITDAPVVAGGVGFSISPVAALEYIGADLGIRGDGESSFPLLVKALAEDRDPGSISGVFTGRPADVELDQQPLRELDPGRQWFAPERYFQEGGQGNIETQRGCNKKCIYCADPLAKGTTVRYRNPESVAEEMERLSRMGVHTFHLCDSEFNLTGKHAQAVCRAIIKKGLGPTVAWYTYALPRPMDKDLAGLMARAGCKGIDFSVDAANDAMLENLGRDFNTADLYECASACRKAGLVFMFDLLLGGPGETDASMKKTVREVKRIGPDCTGVSFGVRLFPGTRLEKQLKKKGPLQENPALHGKTRNNPGLLKPVFYVSEKLGPDPEGYLQKTIGGDRSFFFASRKDVKTNYNYNDNRPLQRAVKKGARGAYWNILRQMR
ncbi:MAG: radical SAM protein [bacterium]